MEAEVLKGLNAFLDHQALIDLDRRHSVHPVVIIKLRRAIQLACSEFF